MKTVRFAQVVAAGGKPEPYTLWSAPKDDRVFQAALKANRVMMVHQENTGAKRDYGEVGYREGEKSGLLIFPKSVREFEGRRVVGVKYDLLAEPPAPPPAEKPAKKPKAVEVAEQAVPAKAEAAQEEKTPTAREATREAEARERSKESAAAKAAAEVERAKDSEREAKAEFTALRVFRPEEDAEEDRPSEGDSSPEKPPEATRPRGRRSKAPASEDKQEAESKQHATARPEPKKSPEAPAAKGEPDPAAAKELAALTRAVQKAMKQLQKGNSVAAYQTLEAAVK